ncbi:hypothetical protein D6D29_06055 [Aureobasidium pullulans]|uniref:Uncharacterized protein n=1 Tax=Aureobasidium pullulans TaxID=5580 RepID=A0A4V4LA97_AURPU|nr:hypothetical protein D6D29_06055 [Aureobasidium pullulans]THW64740.1 hypothetical protein D6D20_02663 [Aureobasidium pullulans]THY28480.1 hypothetical protein D6D00_04182 [Aureobasidium pullulans]TIA18667.1 hypothetical protein D6C81_04998 [Aureobasidium pullulans]
MSSSIAIPKRKQPSTDSSGFASSSSSSPYPSWANNASFSPSSLASTSASPSSASTPSSMARYAERRPSLLGDSLSKSEYTVVNIGGPEAPRLITCIKTSQGFDWNQEIFLPSYLDYDSTGLEHRPDPVHNIHLTDEEAAAIFPK